MDYSLFLKAGLLAIAMFIGWGAHYFIPSLGPDNSIEEMAEQVIYDQTGIDFDLTPSSKE